MMDYVDEYWLIGVVDCKWGLYKEFWWQIIYGGYSLKFCQVNIIIFFFIGRLVDLEEVWSLDFFL